MTERAETALPLQNPPAAIVSELQRLGLVQPMDTWAPLVGGRTNAVWRVAGGNTDVVVKLFNGDAATPLFANNHRSEALLLRVLAPIPLAPELVYAGQTCAGPVLVYKFVRGVMWRHNATVPAAVLRLLHHQPVGPDLQNLPHAAKDVGALKLQVHEMIDEIPASTAVELLDLEPESVDLRLQSTSVLHGDPVPDNFICLDTGAAATARLIDWQCPAIGDPVLDLAVFLSPAMQIITRGAPLTPDERHQFLSAYDDAAVVERLTMLQPVLHWRMAAYCMWKVTRAVSDHAYRAAYTAEIQALRNLMA